MASVCITSIFRFVVLQPVFTAEPPNPFLVLEGNNISLEWSFDLGAGRSLRRVEFDEVTSSGTILIAEVDTVGQTPSFLENDYQGRLQVNVTASQASITILEANRTVDSKNYQFRVVPTGIAPITSSVKISVQCK